LKDKLYLVDFEWSSTKTSLSCGILHGIVWHRDEDVFKYLIAFFSMID